MENSLLLGKSCMKGKLSMAKFESRTGEYNSFGLLPYNIPAPANSRILAASNDSLNSDSLFWEPHSTNLLKEMHAFYVFYRMSYVYYTLFGSVTIKALQCGCEFCCLFNDPLPVLEETGSYIGAKRVRLNPHTI